MAQPMSNVIDIEDLRFTRDRRIVRPQEECSHRHMTIDDKGQFIRCDDCGVQLSPFWVVEHMLEQYERANAKLAAREKRMAEAEQRGVHLRAAQAVEKAWRSQTMVPACPHCGEGIRPTDGLGHTQINKSIDDRRRAAKKGGV
nr:MAG TPA: zinc-ribbon containing domain protein [Caudoviricetes sp.]